MPPYLLDIDLLATLNSTAMNIHVQIPALFSVLNSFGYIPITGISKSYSTSIFNFKAIIYQI